MRDQDQWFSVADAFTAAAFDNSRWYDALAAMAELCGFRVGQLIGIGSTAAIPFNFMTNFDPAAVAEFAAIGGGDPAFNPRVRAGKAAPLMKSLAESDFVTREEFERSEYYASFCRRYDVPFGCVMPMLREGEDMIGLAVFRGERQGHISDAERRVFESIATHARSAVRTQKLLEEQGALVLKGALEALSLEAFLCDSSGAVRAMTQSAEEILRDGKFLRLRQGQLRAVNPMENQLLSAAIRLAALNVTTPEGTGPSSAVVIRDQHQRPLVVDVVPLPRREHVFGFEPRAMVVARTVRRDSKRTLALLQVAYRLTVAEAQVAMLLADGESPDCIAASRGVALSTVRVQIRTLFVKLGVRRQGELVVKLNHLR